jgi:hypothetical protein
MRLRISSLILFNGEFGMCCSMFAVVSVHSIYWDAWIGVKMYNQRYSPKKLKSNKQERNQHRKRYVLTSKRKENIYKRNRTKKGEAKDYYIHYSWLSANKIRGRNKHSNKEE